MLIPNNWHYINGRWTYIVTYFDTEKNLIQTYVDGVAQIKDRIKVEESGLTRLAW